MVNKSLLLLGTLAGLALCSGNAEANPPKPKSPIIQKLPTKAEIKHQERKYRRSILKNLPSDEELRKGDKVNHDRKGKSILRNYLSFNTGYTTLNLNDRHYGKGGSIGVLGDIRYSPLHWLNLRSTVDLNFKSTGVEGRSNATEKQTDFSATLEAHTTLKLSRTGKHSLILGAEYYLGKENLSVGNTDAFKFRQAGGPLIGYGFNSRHCDLYLVASAMWGEKTSSYDSDRDLMVQHLKLSIIPRYGRFEFPVTGEAFHWGITNTTMDRPNLETRVTFQPTVHINPHLSLMLNFRHTFRLGEDHYHNYEVGLGGKIRW